MRRQLLFIAAFASLTRATVQAAEIGHFNPGVLDIRDYFVPEQPGIYGLVYNYYYTTDRLNDNNGNKITSVNVNTRANGFLPVSGPLDVGVNVNLNMYALMPAILWVAPCNVLGARYGGYIAVPFANNSLDAQVTIADRVAGRISNSSLGIGDLYVQPVWLDWGLDHWDFSLAYGFYAPSGRYNTQTFGVPGGTNSVTLESRDNIGLGFWTQQAQGGIAWYPMTNKATAVTGVLTYQYNSEKEDFNLKPGQLLTLNWGISQYLPLPLCPEHKLLLEVGPAGYDSWQITDSSGSDAILPNSRSQVHGVGGQVGVTYVPWSAFATVHGFYEYAAENRFQGGSVGVNFGVKF